MDKHMDIVCDLMDKIEAGLIEMFANTESTDIEEAYKVMDMFKDLSEVKKNLCKAEYYEQIIEAMEESDAKEKLAWDRHMNTEDRNE